jgi:hypothetical protein
MSKLLTVAVAVCLLGVGQAVLVAIVAAVRRGRNIYKILVAIVVVMAPAVLASDRVLTGQSLTWEGRVYLVLLHLGIGGVFFHFMTLPDRSVTLRILVELHHSPAKALAIADLEERYSVRDMIVSRLQQLAEGRFLTIGANGTLTLLPRGERFGRFIVAGRRLFRIDSAN